MSNIIPYSDKEFYGRIQTYKPSYKQEYIKAITNFLTDTVFNYGKQDGNYEVLGYNNDFQKIWAEQFVQFRPVDITVLDDGTHYIAFEDERFEDQGQPDYMRISKYTPSHELIWTITPNEFGYPIEITHDKASGNILIVGYNNAAGENHVNIFDENGTHLFGMEGTRGNIYYESIEPHWLPDNRIALGVDGFDLRDDYYLILNSNLDEIESLDISPGEVGGNITFTDTRISRDSKWLFTYKTDGGDQDNLLEIYKFDLDTYQYTGTFAKIDRAPVNIEFHHKRLAIDDTRVYAIAEVKGTLKVYDYDLNEIKTVAFDTYENTPFNDATIENIYTVDNGKIAVQLGWTENSGTIDKTMPIIYNVNTDELSYLGNQDTFEGFAESMSTTYFNSKTVPERPNYPVLSLVEARATEIDISWSYSPNENIVGFDVYLDDIKQNVNLLSLNAADLHTITGVNEQTDYKINIVSVDGGGNDSVFSNELRVRTPAPVSTQLNSFENDNVGSIPQGFNTPADADVGWEVTDQRALSGVQSFGSSPAIGDSQVAATEYALDISEESFLKFNYLPSSENNYDFFKFYIDGVLEFEESGEFNQDPSGDTLTFKEFQKVLPIGNYTLRFEFAKDGGFAEYDDRSYIDDFGTVSTTDDFESYDIGSLPPEFLVPADADVGWEVTNQRALSGVQSFGSSPAIGDNQTAATEISIELSEATDISFDYLPSSENNYDFFKFYIDGVLEFEESGEFNQDPSGDTLTFKNFVKNLAAGQYVLRFEFAKDGGFAEYDDRCYIDNLYTGV